MKSNIPFFVVNLERDDKKRAHMIELSNSLGLEFHFINAIYGKDLSQDQVDNVYDEALSKKEFGRSLSRGELGCALSHISIYQKMIDEDIEIAIVLEDDVEIDNGIHMFISAVDALPRNLDVLLLGYYSETATERLTMRSFRGNQPITSNYQAVRLVEMAFGTHGYMINLRGAKKLVQVLNKIVKPIDHYTGTENYLNMYGLSSRLVTLNQKFKEMGCIEQDRSVELKVLDNNYDAKAVVKGVLTYLKKIKFIFWLKRLPRRLKEPKQYNN